MSEPTIDHVELICETATNFGATDLNPYLGYSGRFMFGVEVVAITGDDDRELFMAVGYLVATDELPEEALTWFQRRDQFGRGMVRY